MSYCRWSSMNWACDLYVYESCYDDWTIHVAGRRRVGELPPEADWSLIAPGHSEENMAEFMRQYRANADAVSAAEMIAIDLPFAGETFRLPGPGEAADKIEELVALGYVCPDYVVPELREEQAEIDASADTRPEGGDGTKIAAPFTGGAVPEGQTPDTPSHSEAPDNG